MVPVLKAEREELLVAHRGEAHRVPVADADPALADRAHRHLGLEREADLAHHEDVEGRVQDGGHLTGDRYPATR